MDTAASKLVLKRLGPACLAEFGEMADLYQQVFPESERKPFAVLRRMLANASYHFLHATADGHMVGFAIVRALNGSGALLEYMAIAPAHRGRGSGGQLLRAAAHAVDAPSVTLLVEVESDRTETTDRADRTRRKQFYRSLGARELQDLRWIMPPVGDTPPPAMEMLAFSSEPHSVSRHELRHWLLDIYVEVYGQSADDTRIDTMLAALPEEVRLV